MKTPLTLVLTALSLATFAGFAGGHTAQAQGPIVPLPSTSTYLVLVRTGCSSGAGTDANVKIKLSQTTTGGTKSTSLIALDDPNVNDFENGASDAFRFVTTKLDRTDFLYLTHDNTGNKPGWLIRDVSVHNYSTGKTTFFPVHRWLATDECNGVTSIWLKANERPTCTPYYYGAGAGC
jgi:hypothetical protein